MGSAIPFTRMAVPITVVSVAGLFEAEVQDRSATGLLGCAVPADQCSLGLLHHRGRLIYSSSGIQVVACMQSDCASTGVGRGKASTQDQ